MLTKEEFLHLQKLAAISLTDKEESKLQNQINSIVDFLKKLQNISFQPSIWIENTSTLFPISWLYSYEYYWSLFDNSIHKKIDNSIVINSVINN